MYISYYIYVAMKCLETMRGYMIFFFPLSCNVRQGDTDHCGTTVEPKIPLWNLWAHMGGWAVRKRSLDYGQMHNPVNIKKRFS